MRSKGCVLLEQMGKSAKIVEALKALLVVALVHVLTIMRELIVKLQGLVQKGQIGLFVLMEEHFLLRLVVVFVAV